MRLDLTDLLYALSFALGKVETELLGIETGHGRRVAYFSLLMAMEAGMRGEELRDFVGCCLLHDNALTEFIFDELSNSPMSEGMPVKLSDMVTPDRTRLDRDHSVVGEQNIRLLPFHTDIRNIVLYHHENADGSGAMGITAQEMSLKAQILHLADAVDAAHHFYMETMTREEFEELRAWVEERRGTLFSPESVELFLRGVTYDKVESLRYKSIYTTLKGATPEKIIDYSDSEVRNIAQLFAKIVDYKSQFTQNHSRGVAEKAERMARYYGFDDEKTIRFYFAGAMHDIGKLAIINNILEKPGRLTDNEFDRMKYHPNATHFILSQIKGIPDIVEWASNHHEKLNGQGYPHGLSSIDLSFEDQLMACIDIYQALRENRPYRVGTSHEETIAIMAEMADRGEINAQIIRDMDRVMGQKDAG